jgi:hypothetical protein
MEPRESHPPVCGLRGGIRVRGRWYHFHVCHNTLMLLCRTLVIIILALHGIDPVSGQLMS